MVDKKYIEKKANELKFQPEMLEKVYRMTILTQRFMKIPSIKEKVLLRGGTALHFLHSHVPRRLSIDLDFDYIGNIEKDKMESERDPLISDFEKTIYSENYDRRIIRPSYACTQIILKYKNIYERGDEIKVEIDWINRVPVLVPPEQKLFHSFFEIEPFQVATLKFEELLATKIIAFLARQNPPAIRDLFDTYLIATSFKYEMELFRKLVIFIGCAVDTKNFAERIKLEHLKFDLKTFKDLKKYVRSDEEIDPHLAYNAIKHFLRKIFILSDQEKEFIQLISRGIFERSLLFEGYEINTRIKEHPNLLLNFMKMKKAIM